MNLRWALAATVVVIAIALLAQDGLARDAAPVGAQPDPPPAAALLVPDGLTRCPTVEGQPLDASGWGGSVVGISCAEAGALIQDRFNHEFPQVLARGRAWPSDAGSIRELDPTTFQTTGFRCAAFPLPDGMGWHILCSDGERAVSFYFTP